MSGGRGSTRVRSLTSETRTALHLTLMGTVALIRHLLKHCFRYVLTAKFHSDDLEGEFGVYRQMSGGMYHIGVEQVLYSPQLRTMKVFFRTRCID